MIREEDRPALKRIIGAAFAIEADHREELRPILDDATLSVEEKVDRYINAIIDHFEYYPDEN